MLHSVTSPVLTISRLSKVYTEKSVLFEARLPELVLSRGQVLGITGPSGCGKSTLLEILALLSRPASVQTFLLTAAGREYDIAALWRSDPGQFFRLRRSCMGFVHQGGGLMPFLTVHDNILLALQLAQNNTSPAEAGRVRELVTLLGLERVARKLPEQLSYGERQRAAIARALVHRPALLLADEPTSALDPQTSRSVMTLLLQGARECGTAAIVVTHDHDLLDSTGIPRLAMTPCPDTASPCYVLEKHAQDEGGSASCPSFLCRTQAQVCPDTADSVPQTVHQEEQPTERRLREQSPRLQAVSGLPRRVWAMLQTAAMLAWRDFLHDRTLSLCAILAFTATLTPVLLLAGIRTGVTSLFEERLLSNPASLAIVPLSSQRYTQADMDRLASLDGVSFLVPQTRILATSVSLRLPGMTKDSHAEAVPTRPGDPLLQRYASDITAEAVVLTRQTARLLPSVRPGDTLTLTIGRRHEGRLEQVSMQLPVHAILPDAADGADHIYVPFAILQDMERYRDGYAVPERNWPGRLEDRQHMTFAGFRMYAATLDDVVILRDRLQELGIRVHTWAREVETLQQLRHGLSLTAAIISAVALSGMIFSLASLATSAVRRKTRLFAQCSLMGMNRWEQTLLPLFQQVFIACGAILLSAMLYAAASRVFDSIIGPWLGSSARICILETEFYILLQAAMLVLSCVCGLAACQRILSFQPAEILRHDA